MTIKELTTKDFHAFVSKGEVIVDFWAEWCGPCKIMDPQLKKAADKLSNIKFAKLNVDDNYEVSSEFQVMSIPTTIFFKDGEIVEKIVGAMTADMIERKAKEAFS